MTGRDPHSTRWPQVEGYCTPLSVAAGEVVEVRCASRAHRFSYEVARIGAERVVVATAGGLATDDHPVPERAWATGCGWPVTFTIETDDAWPSGFYEVRFTVDGTNEHDPTSSSEAFFVLRRPPARPANDALLVLSTNTWNAYNQWGGACLYSGATAVSFERPLERGYLRRPAAPDEVDFDGRITNIADPSDPEHGRLVAYQQEHHYPLWTASAGWHNWERRFVLWAEREGITLDFAIDADLETVPVLAGHRLLLAVGHDEYWSAGMRDAVDRFVDEGGSFAVFSGNTCFWQVRYEDDGATMVCHKGGARINDPLRRTDPSRMTSMWSDPRVGRPESETIGLSFTRGGYHRIGEAVADGSGSYTVHRPDHWALTGTGLAAGASIGDGSFIVGYEVDGVAADWSTEPPIPSGEDGAPPDLEIVASAPARLISITDEVCEAPRDLWASLDPPGDLEGVSMVLFGDASPGNVAKIAEGHAVMASFTRGRGTVFNAGTTDWAYGLDRDPVVGRITANVIRHLRSIATPA